MRISKKQREEAIEECLLRADHFEVGKRTAPSDFFLSSIYHSGLAGDAAYAVAGLVPLTVADCYLEAAALLRGDDDHEPWSPGDPIYLRTKQGA